jgi:hypothetical protein
MQRFRCFALLTNSVHADDLHHRPPLSMHLGNPISHVYATAVQLWLRYRSRDRQQQDSGDHHVFDGITAPAKSRIEHC